MKRLVRKTAISTSAMKASTDIFSVIIWRTSDIPENMSEI